jgi:UDP-sulfoquinovose synthase
MRVFNQFTEQFSVLDLARRVAAVAEQMGITAQIEHLTNPRVEREAHFYEAKHTKLLDLGLQPHLLSDETIGGLLERALRHRERIDLSRVRPSVQWR